MKLTSHILVTLPIHYILSTTLISHQGSLLFLTATLSLLPLLVEVNGLLIGYAQSIRLRRTASGVLTIAHPARSGYRTFGPHPHNSLLPLLVEVNGFEPMTPSLQS